MNLTVCESIQLESMIQKARLAGKNEQIVVLLFRSHGQAGLEEAGVKLRKSDFLNFVLMCVTYLVQLDYFQS
jgi:hypothetical protein